MQLAETLRQIGDDDGCHAAFECSGADSSLKTAMHVGFVRPFFKMDLTLFISINNKLNSSKYFN